MASAANVATVAKRLAHDTEQLATARTDMTETQRELRQVRREHRILRAHIEAEDRVLLPVLEDPDAMRRHEPAGSPTTG